MIVKEEISKKYIYGQSNNLYIQREKQRWWHYKVFLITHDFDNKVQSYWESQLNAFIY
jgi:hypothetical protein